VNDLEKAIENARLQSLVQRTINNKSRDIKSRSINVPGIRAADIRPGGADKRIEHAQEKLPRKTTEIKHAVSGGNNSKYNGTNGDGNLNYDAINGDSYAKYDAINGDSHSNYDVSNGDSYPNYEATDGDRYAKYNASDGDRYANYNASDGDRYAKYNATDGDRYAECDAIDDDRYSKYNTTNISPNSSNQNSPMCVLPLKEMQSAGFITPTLEKGKLTEEYRRIKRPLVNNMRKEMITNGLKNVIAVTSSISQEGKTYSAVNLAMSMALEPERTVLLIDADVVKGAVGRLFSVSRDQQGLTDVLSDDSIDAAEVIMRTNVNNLSFMAGGKMKSNTNELLASDVMSDLIVEQATRYDDRIVILDCPPILQTNEANILIDHAGQVVFVVAEQETRQKQVLNAIDQIDKEKYVGMLINKSSSRLGNYDYYRHYI